MSNREIDVRGKACPQPVIETRRALEDAHVMTLRVVLDSEASAENVARTARNLGCDVSLEDLGTGEIHIVINRGAGGVSGTQDAGDMGARDLCGGSSNVTVFVASDVLGRGDDDLGRALMIAFIKTIKDVVPRPRALIFINSGAKLTVEGSNLIGTIRELEDSGVKVLVCGTCLDYYGVIDKLKVGSVSNMVEILSTMVTSDRVIRP